MDGVVLKNVNVKMIKSVMGKVMINQWLFV